MDVLFSFSGSDSAGALESLSRWLRGDPSFGGRVRTIRSAPEPGQLGLPPEALAVALGSGGAVTMLASSLASSLKTWLGRPRGARLRLRIREGEREVDIELSNLERADASELGKMLLERVQDGRDAS